MRVLFITHRLPYAPNRGDRVRAHGIVRVLAGETDLEVVSLVHDDEELAQVPTLEAMGVKVHAFPTRRLRGYFNAARTLAGARPLTHSLLDAPGLRARLEHLADTRPPDVVLAFCSGMARFALEPSLASFPLVLDMVDVDSAKWASLARTARWPKSTVFRREARCLATFERDAARHAVTNIVVSERERDALAQIAPGATVDVLPVGVDLERLRPRTAPTEAPHVVFCGVMNYAPNIEGVRWFVEQVWPIVRRRCPGARFSIVGANPTGEVRELAMADGSIEVTGTVPDVIDYLSTSAVSVAPLLTSHGLQSKVLESLAAGLPVVVTEQVVGGLPAGTRNGCRIGSAAGEFASQVVALLEMTGSQRRAIAGAADLTTVSCEAQGPKWLRILERAAGIGCRDANVAYARIPRAAPSNVSR